MGGGFLANMGGAVAGSVIGHGISRAIFGGHGSESSEPAETGGDLSSPQDQQQLQSRCAPQFLAFNSCLDRNNNDIGYCQTFFDQYKSCTQGSSYGFSKD